MLLYFIYSRLAIWIGFLLDLLLGDPYSFPHPVRLMGRWISWLDRHLRIKNENPRADQSNCENGNETDIHSNCENGNKTDIHSNCESRNGTVDPSDNKRRKTSLDQTLRGGILVVLVLLPSVALPLLILLACYRIYFGVGLAVESIFCYQMLAARCLEVESKKVYTALQAGDPEGARRAVSMIVGRDTDRLDARGITRAAVETVAENTSDGEIAPLFYMFLFGAVGGFFYKAANTMDSMIGYKNETYRTFGTCAARLDDVLNFLPSRIAALLMILYAFLEESLSGRNAWRIWRRDRLKHASPNSAQTESACAGALGVQLAGDAWYFGKPVKKETLGDPDREIEYKDILKAHRLMYGTSAFMLVLGTAVTGILVFLVFL